MATREEWDALAFLQHAKYIAAARAAGATGDLRVGVKMTRPDLRTHDRFRWPAPMPGEVVHVACDAWDDRNEGSCPHSDGDGLCVAHHARHVTSGTVRSIAEGVGLALVYRASDGRSDDPDKVRVPEVWVVDVFAPLDLIAEGAVSNLSGANLSNANLWDANLRRANLWDANLSGANLSNADLSGANLSGANLWDANLRRANLSGANLWDANLWDANLWDADLRRADLRRADLRRANLSGANLSGANLSNADLSGAIGRDDWGALVKRGALCE